jgi:ribosome biogenesis GTPase A
MDNIQWFPGHMKKAERLIQQNLSMVDVCLELIDARIPFSGCCHYLEKFLTKPRLLVLNKCDSADDAVTQKWLAYFSAQKINAVAVSAKTGWGINKILPALREKVLKDLIERRAARGLKQPLRIMVVGIPNVGKSAFINKITQKSGAKVEDRPGVTRQKQWLKMNGNEAELLDMPGVLAPKYENQIVAQNLAFIGSIRDGILDTVDLSLKLINVLRENYSENICQRYKINFSAEDTPLQILENIGKKRGMLVSGGEVDTERTSIMFLDEYRGGKIGRITLETPPINSK